jgi:uncharacterized membrane protein
MLRQHIPERIIGDPLFRWRGGDVSRIEALTDMVFAFALTLLVVSLEVPRTFADLKGVLLATPAFAFAFAMLVLVWYFHYLFHRRYGFEDFTTFLLNAVLLFVILLYVYPMKFLAVVLQQMFSGQGVEKEVVDGAQMGQLMMIYGTGFALIFALFCLMYVHAWRRRDALGLDSVERYLTRQGIVAHALSAGVGLLSVTIAACAHSNQGLAAAGWSYFLMWPLHWWHGRRTSATSERMAAG